MGKHILTKKIFVNKEWFTLKKEPIKLFSLQNTQRNIYNSEGAHFVGLLSVQLLRSNVDPWSSLYWRDSQYTKQRLMESQMLCWFLVVWSCQIES